MPTASEPSQGAEPGVEIDAAELRGALERVLGELDADDRVGPLLRAAELRVRITLTDLAQSVLLCPPELPEHNLRWSFEGSRPVGSLEALELEMTSALANRWLQGSESLPVAIAQGRAQVRGRPASVLAFLPALRLVAEPYRRLVEAEFPALRASAASG